jgi:hypothetical protein
VMTPNFPTPAATGLMELSLATQEVRHTP